MSKTQAHKLYDMQQRKKDRLRDLTNQLKDEVYGQSKLLGESYGHFSLAISELEQGVSWFGSCSEAQRQEAMEAKA